MGTDSEHNVFSVSNLRNAVLIDLGHNRKLQELLLEDFVEDMRYCGNNPQIDLPHAGALTIAYPFCLRPYKTHNSVMTFAAKHGCIV